MISLKKHIDEYDRELSQAFLAAYGDALASTVRSCSRAVPPLAEGLHEVLSHINQRLASTLTPPDAGDIQQEFDAGLLRWEREAEQLSKDNIAHVKEIMMAVAASASAIAKRSRRQSEQFSKVTEELTSVGRMEDLIAIRRSVIRITSEIKRCVKEMKRDGESTVAALQAQIAVYREKISEFQQRDGMDPLTGLANRTAVEVGIQDRIAWSSEFCLAIVDLNGFKPINDRFGHAAGDDLLRQFAQELRLVFRATDLVGRWGGDEFAVVIDSGLQDAQQSLGRLRQWVFGEYSITHGEQPVTVPVSAAIGVAAWDGSETAAELFNRADQLMYVDKRTSGMADRTGQRRARNVAEAGQALQTRR